MLNIYSNMYIDREWDTYTGMQYHLLLCQTEMYERVGEWRLCVFVWNQVQGVTPGGGGWKKIVSTSFSHSSVVVCMWIERFIYGWDVSIEDLRSASPRHWFGRSMQYGNDE